MNYLFKGLTRTYIVFYLVVKTSLGILIIIFQQLQYAHLWWIKNKIKSEQSYLWLSYTLIM